jgi:hypothetical protein
MARFLPSALPAQFLALAYKRFAWLLRFGLKSTFSTFPKMSQDKKVVAKTKLSLSEKKNLGFLE